MAFITCSWWFMGHFLSLKGKNCFIYVYMAFDCVSFIYAYMAFDFVFLKANELLGKE